MNPEAAMEQYVALLSDRVPGWMEDNSDVSPLLFRQWLCLISLVTSITENIWQNFILTRFFLQGELKFESADPKIPGAMAPDINSFPDQEKIFTQERWFDVGYLRFSFMLMYCLWHQNF